MTSCQTLTSCRFYAPRLPQICHSEFAEKKTGHPIKMPTRLFRYRNPLFDSVRYVFAVMCPLLCVRCPLYRCSHFAHFLSFLMVRLKPHDEGIRIRIHSGQVQVTSLIHDQDSLAAAKHGLPLVIAVESEVIPRFPCRIAERLICRCPFQIR